MFTTFARVAIQATSGLAEYVPAFTFTSMTTAVVVESHPDAAPPEESVDELGCENRQNQLAETLAVARSEAATSSFHLAK